MKTFERRYDIDWMRVIAIGLLIIFHIAVVFQPWAVFIKFIQSQTHLTKLWSAMALLNIWRIPLLFFVSGMGVCFSLRKRTWKQLVFERTQRILIPLIFGIIAIVPIHQFIFQSYYLLNLKYSIDLGHLWFLANIFIYVLLLLPLFIYLKKLDDKNKLGWLRKLAASPLLFIFIIIAFVIESLIINPTFFELYYMTSHGFWLGFLAFLFGFLFVLFGKPVWENLNKWKWIFILFALSFYLTRLFYFNLNSPNYLKSIESQFWIFGSFGLANRYLNKPGNTLKYLSQAAYPIYIIHMIFLYAATYFIIPLSIPVIFKIIIIIIITSTACFLFYEFFVRRIKYIRPLFGLKFEKLLSII